MGPPLPDLGGGVKSQELSFFPDEIARALESLLLLERGFPDDLSYDEQELWEMRFADWERGEAVDEGVAMLKERAALKRRANRLLAAQSQGEGGDAS